MQTWLVTALVLGLLCALLRVLSGYCRRARPHPEVVRKVLHVAMALVALSFPWLIPSRLPALVLASSATLILLALRHCSSLQRHFGGVIDGVKRHSWGEIVFPAGIYLTFLLSQAEPQYYCIPVLVLGLADPAAALVGLRYGRRFYATADGIKSVEGSLAFFGVALLCTLAGLLLLTALSLGAALGSALLLAALITLVEGRSWSGLDNLFIPVFAFAVLKLLLGSVSSSPGFWPGALLGGLALLSLCLAWDRPARRQLGETHKLELRARIRPF